MSGRRQRATPRFYLFLVIVITGFPIILKHFQDFVSGDPKKQRLVVVRSGVLLEDVMLPHERVKLFTVTLLLLALK